LVNGANPLHALAIVNATAVTMAPFQGRDGARASVGEDDLGVLRNAAILIDGGRIVSVGAAADIPSAVEYIDARGRVVMPGFVDAHTHALYAGDRIEDFEAIAAGNQPRLGIRYTVEQTRLCTPAQLIDVGAQRLGLMKSHGTTTAEVKTGYALTADGEVGMLQAMKALDERSDMPHIIPTFCGAHALPPEFDDYDAFVEELCGNILPRVIETGLARYADAFCEKGFFTPEQSERFLCACAKSGLGLRLHADELHPSGGSALAARLRCASADHLNYVDAGGIAALARSGSIAVLCPATNEYLGLDRYAPARDLISAGVPVALATDFNPGTSPCPSLQTVAHLARRRLKMTAPEVIAAVTVQAARSLGSNGGSLVPGRCADLVILDTWDYREFGYYFGANLAARTIVSKPRIPAVV
jgi:imidazolonepropionase